MSIKHILAPVTGETDATHVMLTAMRLALRLGAHVTATDTAPDPSPFIDPGDTAMPISYYDEIRTTLNNVQKHKRERARGFFAAGVGITKIAMTEEAGTLPSASWFESTTVAGATVSTLGPLADLIVINLPGAQGGIAELEIVESAVFSVRRPVLAMPVGVSDITASAVLAWNGSLEAADAAERALDVLAPGTPVTVVQAGEVKRDGTPAETLLSYLGWHGHPATLRRIDETKSVAQALLAAAKSAGAGLIIMGAYTHSRLREMVLGGVTDFMLKNSDIPLLLAH